MSSLTPLEAIKAAVKTARSQEAFARELGVSQPTVWRWVNGVHQVPAEQVLPIEALTGVSKHDIRPDLHPRCLTHAETTAHLDASR